MRDRVVWMVFEHPSEFGNQIAAIKSIASKIGCVLIRFVLGFAVLRRKAVDAMALRKLNGTGSNRWNLSTASFGKPMKF